MNRRAVLAGVGAASLAVAGCLDQQSEPTDDGTNPSTDSNGDETAPEEDDSDGPKATIEAFADGFTNDDLEAVRERIAPDSKLLDDLDNELVEEFAFEPVELDLHDQTDDEAVVDVVWTITDADGTEHEEQSTVTLQRDEDEWLIVTLEDEQDESSEEARAGVDISKDPEADAATVGVTSIGNADGVFVSRDGEQDVCDDSLDAAGDSCLVEGVGQYQIIAYIGESPADAETKTTIHSFEIDG
ncbi:hypothetical protein ACLI4Z_08460 [Natrialbaceae archaeon A-arb3/5]